MNRSLVTLTLLPLNQLLPNDVVAEHESEVLESRIHRPQPTWMKHRVQGMRQMFQNRLSERCTFHGSVSRGLFLCGKRDVILLGDTVLAEKSVPWQILATGNRLTRRIFDANLPFVFLISLRIVCIAVHHTSIIVMRQLVDSTSAKTR